MTIRVGLDDFNEIAGSNGQGYVSNGKRRLVVVPAASIQREKVEWLDRGRVPIGNVTILAGVGGLGKSQWACLLASRLSRGELGEAASTIIATAEDTPSTTVIPRLQAVEADLNLVHFVTVKTKEGDEDGIEIPDDLAELAEMVQMFGVKLVVVDPLVAHLPLKIDTHRDQSVRRALAPLYRLAKVTDCAVLTLLHLNKAEGLSRMNRISGSTGFRNAARSVLMLERDPDDPEGDRGRRRVLIHEKCNIGREQDPLLYEVQPILLPPDGNAPAVHTSRLRLLEVSSVGNACDTDFDWQGVA